MSLWYFSYTNCVKFVCCRDSLLGPLFKLLYRTFSNEWVHSVFVHDEKQIQVSCRNSDSMSSAISYIQQTLLIILEDISSSLTNSVPLGVCCNILEFKFVVIADADSWVVFLFSFFICVALILFPLFCGRIT